MTETSLIIVSTNQNTGTKIQKSVTDINPEATNAELKDFAQSFNGLSTNLYNEAYRIDKRNVNDEE